VGARARRRFGAKSGNTTVYALAALHSLYVSGLRLADAAIESVPLKATPRPGQGMPLPAGPKIIRSRFMEQGMGGEDTKSFAAVNLLLDICFCCGTLKRQRRPRMLNCHRMVHIRQR